MDIVAILWLTSGLIGIIGFFFPMEWRNQLAIKIIFSVILLWASIFIIYLDSKINKIERISKSANILIKEKEMKFTHEWFILASLSFLEQNKKDFPESYERAKEIFKEYSKSNFKSLESVNASFELEWLIRGIGILSTSEE